MDKANKVKDDDNGHDEHDDKDDDKVNTYAIHTQWMDKHT